MATRRTARPARRALAVAAVPLLAGLAVLLPSTAAQAHSLESSTISAHVTDGGVDATVTIAVETLEEATGLDLSSADAATSSDEVVEYLAEHLAATSTDGTAWGETWSDVTRETVDGIDSLSVDVTFATGTSDTSAFELTYDAVIEAVPGHEAVVVLTDADGTVSTPGVLTAADDTLTVTTAAAGTSSGGDTGILDMVGYGFHHVLEGADHLLFLAALLLTAPVVAVAGRWRPRTGLLPTGRRILGIATSFTVGHSVTLLASALGWVAVPSRPVEVLVAVSVAVAAVHAARPLVRGGENAIAAGFGLVHGLAFAGILDGLGLTGTLSVPALLAFNVGVELAQLTATLLVFPSLYLLARTPWYPAARIAGAGIALVAATAWVLDRLGVLANPLGGVEDAAVAHLWVTAAVLAGVAAVAVASHAGAKRSLTRHPERLTSAPLLDTIES